MTFQHDTLQPSRIAIWLVALFAPRPDADFILGDLLEEFSRVASEQGPSSARLWFWRHTVRTVASLIAAEFRTAPWTIMAVATGAFLLRWYVSWRSNAVITRAIETALDRYGLYERYPHAYFTFLTSGVFIERLILNALIGVLVAIVAKRCEMAAALVLGLAGLALAIQSDIAWVVRTGDYGVLRTLLETFAFSVATAAAAAAVRLHRSHPAPPTACS